jgi:hypothetical protein
MTNEEKDKLIIKKITNSNNFDWIKLELENKRKFNKAVIEEIKKIPSIEIANLMSYLFKK